MNIREALSLEHSKTQALRIAEFIGDDPKKFGELMKIFFAGEYRPAQRAAYVFMFSVEKHPGLVKPYLKKLVAQLQCGNVHDAIKRNVVRFLQFIEIPKNLEGKIYSHCIDLIDNPQEPVAVRAFALTVATRIGKHEPALVEELCLTIDKHLQHTSVAFRQRAKEILRCRKQMNA